MCLTRLSSLIKQAETAMHLVLTLFVFTVEMDQGMAKGTGRAVVVDPTVWLSDT